MSFPAQGMESVYRNRLPDVARLLQSKHGDKYLIINVSDRSYDTTLFNDQVRLIGVKSKLVELFYNMMLVRHHDISIQYRVRPF